MDHAGETSPLISCADGTKLEAVPLEVCSTGYYCQAVAWSAPEMATTKQMCAKKGDPVPTPDNSILPGDVCTKKSECINNAGGADCTNGKCVTTVKVGDACKDGQGAAKSNMCPENSYCDAASFKCVAALAKDAACDKTKPCSSGLACIGSADGATYTCQNLMKAADGTKFKIDKIYNPGLIYSEKTFCQSYNAFDTGNGVYECRPGDKSKDTTEDALKRADAAKMCDYTTFNDATATATKGVDKSEAPKCGFNTDNSYYCNKRVGDSWFQGAYSTLKGKDVTSYTCHVDSAWTACQSFVDPNADLLTTLAKRQYEVTPGAWAAVANNDKCVRSSVTLAYWGTVDSSVGYSVVSTLAAVVAIISMIALF